MKIISPFKDYYDYVQHICGGGDAKINYVRKRLGEVEWHHGTMIVKNLEVEVDHLPKLSSGYRYISERVCYGDSHFRWLIICGKPYPLVKVGRNESGEDAFEILNPERHKDIVTRSSYMSYITPVGEENLLLVDISRKIGQPIFIINWCHSKIFNKKAKVIIDGDYPILSSLCVPSVYPAEQLYQDLSYFIVNKMKESPDMMPPTTMSNKEKIVQHGFDVKKSFRHRK